MATVKIVVTKVAKSTENGKTLTSVRLFLEGRSLWLNSDSVKSFKLVDKDSAVELDDTEFNGSKFERLKCSNENGTYWKLVPKCSFGIGE